MICLDLYQAQQCLVLVQVAVEMTALASAAHRPGRVSPAAQSLTERVCLCEALLRVAALPETCLPLGPFLPCYAWWRGPKPVKLLPGVLRQIHHSAGQ